MRIAEVLLGQHGPSFRGGEARTRNLEIPRYAIAHLRSGPEPVIGRRKAPTPLGPSRNEAGEPSSGLISRSAPFSAPQASHETLFKNLGLSGRALRAPRRHRADAAIDLHVLVRRRDGKVHRRDLFGRTIAFAARLRGADRAVAFDLAASRAVHAAGTAVAATASGGALNPRSRGIFLGDRLSAARRRRHLLSGLSDFRYRAIGDRAARACRLAALDRDPDRLLRCTDGAASIDTDDELARRHRAGREPVVCGLDADHPLAAGDTRYP